MTLRQERDFFENCLKLVLNMTGDLYVAEQYHTGRDLTRLRIVAVEDKVRGRLYVKLVSPEQYTELFKERANERTITG